MAQKHRQKIPVITKKIISRVTICGLLLCTLIFITGYSAFSRQFRVQYENTIKSVSDAARECLNPDSFETYLNTKQTDQEYQSVEQILQYLVDDFDLNFIYVSSVKGTNYTDVTYIYNPVREDSAFTPFELGAFEVYEEEGFNRSAKRVLEQGETDIRHTSKSRSGSHITAMVPVYDSNQNIIAVLGSQKSTQEFVDARYWFINIVIAAELLFGLLFIALFSSYFSLSFIKPLTLITHETDHFASYGGEPSDRLLEIKNQDEIGILAHSVHQMEYDVCSNMKELTEVTAEKERIETELNVAQKIQEGILPKGYPEMPQGINFDLATMMTPAKEVGGDLYDYMMIDDDHIMLVVGDVSGKGIPAAIFMAIVKTLIDSCAGHGLGPKQIFESVNNQLCKGNKMSLFVTCWMGILTFSTGELKFVNAGHPFPVLYHAGEFSLLKTKPNFVLAGMENFSYTEHSIKIEKGDRLFVYTDGVTEATNAQEQLFGDERMLAAIKQTSDKTAQETLSFVRSQVDAFVGEAEQFDDLTMLEFILK